ncbi:MAG TPA: protein-disulfide reductase DsbD domain-containing protein, partial [Ancylobacter sp.]
MAWQALARAIRAAVLGLVCLSSLGATAGETPHFTALFAPQAAAEAFTLEAARSTSGTLLLHWKVEPGNYLYRDSLEATLDGAPVRLDLPAGENKDDPTFGTVQIFRRDVEAGTGDLGTAGQLRVSYQGCSEAGICFPPQARLVDLASLDISDAPPGSSENTAGKEPATQSTATPMDDGDGIAALFRSGLGWTMLAFLGFGLLLALTPCVFPMIPILAGMLTRSGGALTWRRSLALTGAYVMAMAGAYGLVGAVAGWSGANLQAALQTPLALGVTAAIFVALALSMFGLFDLALPAGLSTRLGGRGGTGSLGGAAL